MAITLRSAGFRELEDTVDQTFSPVEVEQLCNKELGVYVQVDHKRARWRFGFDGKEYSNWLK